MSMLYTIGYEGRGTAAAIGNVDPLASRYASTAIANFIRVLQAHQIRRLIDVRHRAYSRNPQFTKSALERYLRCGGISYLHLPHFGVPSSERQGDRQEVLDRYEDCLRVLWGGRQGWCFPDLEGMIDGHTAIMCVETWPDECHRGRLAKVLGEQFGCSIGHILTKPAEMLYETPAYTPAIPLGD